MSKHVRELFDLSGRVAVVTGGSGHQFGAQITEALAECGASVIITSRDDAKAEGKAEEYRERGLKVTGIALEIASETAIQDFSKKVEKDFGGCDILVNNACAGKIEPFETISLEDWNRVMHINTTVPLLMARNLAPMMLSRGKGSIVNLATIYAVASPDHRIYGNSGLNSPLVYGAGKAALIQMTRYWATYWAPTIRVNCISPGGLFNNQDPAFVEKYSQKTPMGRMAGPSDLKGLAAYLASDASAYVTGQNFMLDGGWTAW